MRSTAMQACIVLFSLVSFFTPLSAGRLNTTTLRVANQTDDLVYCAFYYRQLDTLTRASEPAILPGHNAVTLHLPSTRLFSSRILALSDNPNMPTSTTKSGHPFLFPPQHVGLWEPDDFTLHLSTHTNTSRLSSTHEWEEECKHTHEYQAHTQQYEYAEHVAKVSAARPEQEVTYITKRLNHAKSAQEALLGTTLDRPLRIGICASGGGFRALLATLGMLTGLEDLDLLGSITTFAGLSGSTWAVLSWLASNSALHQYADDITTRLHRGLMHHLSEQYDDLAQVKKQKKLCGLPMSAVDLYGIGLSHTLLKPMHSNHTEIRFPDVANWLTPESHPFVICTAATRYEPGAPYTWLTFSPFSICQLAYSQYIPAWALGRAFWQGSSINATPPPLLGYVMGAFGSAFSISIRDALERAPEALQQVANMLLPSHWYEHITQARWANAKITAAYLPNFTYGLETAENKDQEWLCIIDGVYLNNIPLLPLLSQHEEPLDLVIIMDSKRERTQRLKTLRDAYENCAKRGYRLAPLSTDQIHHNTVTLNHGAPDESAVMYITLEPDETFDATFNATLDKRYITPNLFYSPHASSQLLASVRHSITSRRDLFINALREIAHAE